MKIFKYSVPSRSYVTLPSGSKPLHFGFDPKGTLCVWAAVHDVEPDGPVVSVKILATGESVSDDDIYIGTVADGPYIWHAFQEP